MKELKLLLQQVKAIDAQVEMLSKVCSASKDNLKQAHLILINYLLDNNLYDKEWSEQGDGEGTFQFGLGLNDSGDYEYDLTIDAFIDESEYQGGSDDMGNVETIKDTFIECHQVLALSDLDGNEIELDDDTIEKIHTVFTTK